MSIEEYFDTCIDVWDRYTRTPCMVEDMKAVVKQFDSSKNYGDIEENRLEDLTNTFDRIRKEIYNQ